MDELLEFRQGIINFYKRNETPINIILKFIIGFFIFNRLSLLAAGKGSGKALLISLLCGVFTAIVPPNGFYLLSIAAICYYISFVSIEGAILAGLILFIFWVFYVRIFPKESLVIPIMLLGFYLKIPYLAVAFAALYIGFLAVVPVGISCFLWSFSTILLPKIAEIAPKASFSPMGMPDAFIKIYACFMEAFTENTDWIAAFGIFSIALIGGYIIASFSFDYSKETSIFISSLVMLFGFLMAYAFGVEVLGIMGIILGNIISALIVMIIRYFDIVLDYSSAKNVEFEDDDNYYYVKVIPKAICPGKNHTRRT